MPQLIEVPSIGQVEFPDGMNDDDISAVIKRSYPEIHKPSHPLQVGSVSLQVPGDIAENALRDAPQIDTTPILEAGLAGARAMTPPTGIEDVPGTATALLHGLGKGSASTAAGMGVVSAATASGLNPAIGVVSGPLAPLTVPAAGILEFLGGMLLANKAISKTEQAISPHSETLQAVQEAETAHPVAEAIGQQIPMIPIAARSLQGYVDIAKAAETAGQATRQIGLRAGGAALGGVGMEAARPHIEQGFNFVGQSLGLTSDQIQQPGMRSFLENAAIGAVLGGEGGTEQTAKTTGMKAHVRTVSEDALRVAASDPGFKQSDPQLHGIVVNELAARNAESVGATATAQAARETPVEAPTAESAVPEQTTSETQPQAIERGQEQPISPTQLAGEQPATKGGETIPPVATPQTGARAQAFDANHPVVADRPINEEHVSAAAEHFATIPLIELNKGDAKGAAMIVRNTDPATRDQLPVKLVENPMTTQTVTGRDSYQHTPELDFVTAQEALRAAQARGFDVDESALGALGSERDVTRPSANAGTTGERGQTEPQPARPAQSAAEKGAAELEALNRSLEQVTAEARDAQKAGDIEEANDLKRHAGLIRKRIAIVQARGREQTSTEPWQQTRGQSPLTPAEHVAAVKAAVGAGKPVPEEVLAEYRGRAWADKALKELRKQAEAKPTVTERPAPERTFSTRQPTDSFGTEETPVVSALINDIGGVLSESQARKTGKYQRNAELWDDKPSLSHPTHRKIYSSNGVMPDEAAQGLYEQGLISEPTVGAMWRAVERESKSVRGTARIESGQAAQEKQATAFGKAAGKATKANQPVNTNDLQVGDTVKVGTEPMKVTAIDADTFDVTLEDGKKYGVQHVRDNEVIYGQHTAITRPKEDFAGAQTPTELPTLRSGENQGDLLSKQTEDLTLVGEKGTDFAKREAEKLAAEKAAQQAKDLQEQQQAKLFEASKDWTSATEETKPASEPGKGMKLGGKESGAINLPRFADRKMSDLDRATAARSAKMQKSFDDATRAQKEIKKAAPTERRQAAISVYMEADGDTGTLAAWETGAKGKAFKQAAKDAQSLTPEEIAVAQKARAAFKVLETRGNKFDVLKSGRDNYVPHVWDVKKGSGFGGSKLKQNFKFAKARTFENFAEGDAAGFEPKTMAIGKLLPAYLHEMNRVIADRQFVQDISKGLAKDKRPLVLPRGRVSTIEETPGDKVFLANPDAFKTAKDAAGNPIEQGDYEVVNHPALHDWRWEAKDAEGNPIFMRDDLALHPDTAKRVEAVLGKSAIREWYNRPSEGVSQVPKVIAKALDRSQAVMKREMFGLLAPFHQVQEGWHGIAHRVNPFSNIPKVDLRDAGQMDAAKHGLMLLPDRSSAQNYMEGVGGKGTFLTQAARWFGESKAGDNIAGKASAAIADVVDGYQNYLFHSYIPGLKYKTYEAIRGRNMHLYESELTSGKLSESDVKLLSAEQTNAAYGHLNYALLDQNPTMQHLKQLTLLAPDFLEARSRFVGQAVKGITGSKVGVEQFRAIATIALVQAGVAFTAAQIFGGNWNPKRPFEFERKGRRYTLRSVPEDLFNLGADVVGMVKGGDNGIPFISARINPMLQSGIQGISGRNYRGEKVSALDTLEELFAKYIPITARSIPGIRNLTETSRNNPVSPMEQLAGSMGLKISRQSPVTDTHTLASQWMDKQKIPRDRGSYPVSKYQQLRYALEDGDIERAQAELDKLKKETGTISPFSRHKLSDGFRESVNRPFTQSKEMDKKFAASLNARDKAVFDLAVQKRADILTRFRGLH